MSDVPTPNPDPNPNPYSAPTSLEPTADSVALGGIQSSFQQARSLAHWQLFFAILCFLAFGIVVLYVGLMVVLFSSQGGFRVVTLSLAIATLVMSFFMLVYLMVGVLFVRGSAASKRFANTPDPTTLNTMMNTQLWLWRTLGVLTLGGLALWLLGMLLTVFLVDQ